MKERKRKERRCCWHYLVFFLWYICRMFCIIVDAINSPFGDRSFECTASIGVARGGPGVPVTPLCKPSCKQTTYNIQMTI